MFKHCNIRFKNSLLCIITILLFSRDTLAIFTSLAKNDPVPIFDALDPSCYLTTAEKLWYADDDWADKKKSRFTFSISPFAQNANHGKTINGEPTVIPTPSGTANAYTELGNLTGRTSLIALTYGHTPPGQTSEGEPIAPNQLPPLLQTARTKIFGNLVPPVLEPETNYIDDARYIDPAQLFGFLSFPLKYRKRGLRGSFQVMLGKGFGLSFETGVASMTQTSIGKIEEPTTGSFPADGDPASQITADNVNDYLTDQFDSILEELNLEIERCAQTSIEEVRLSLFWRKVIELNGDNDEWPYVLLVPYAECMGSISPGKRVNPQHLFEVPFGNNKHAAAGFNVGMNFDFIETIEIGGEVGYVHFFQHSFSNVHVPTSEFQNNIYPFVTDIKVKPGINWHFAGKISAYHFLDKLSMYFQYVMFEHKEDTITLKNPDATFMPDVLEEKSCFKGKLANIGFTYDISPNASLGFVWQAPLSQRNIYESTTILFSFSATL